MNFSQKVSGVDYEFCRRKSLDGAEHSSSSLIVTTGYKELIILTIIIR